MKKIVAVTLLTAMLAGCSTMTGQSAEPLLAKREEPGVVLCMSERAGNGLRLVGRINQGIYPITGVSLQWRTTGFADSVPGIPGEAPGGMVLAEPRSTKVNYRKGANEVSYDIGADAARGLRDKVIWYRWLVTYDHGGTPRIDATAIHRTSIEEAGLPRATGTPGPDTSVALPVSARR
jgi:hypothetical protein